MEPAADEPIPGALEPVEERPHQLDRAETMTTIRLLTLVVPAPAVVLVAAVLGVAEAAEPVAAPEEAEVVEEEAGEDHLPPSPCAIPC